MWSVVGAAFGWQGRNWSPGLGGLHRWSWLGLCVLGLLLKGLDPFPEARRAACLCFYSLSPRAQHGSGRPGGRLAAVSEYLMSRRRRQQPNRRVRDGELGRRPCAPLCLARVPFSPLAQPPLPTFSGFKPGVSDPWDGDKCFALKTSVRPPWPANEGRGAGTRPSGPSVAVVGSLCDGGGGYARDVRPCLRVPEVGAGVAPGPRWRRGAQRPSPARPRLLARRPRPRLRPAGFAGWRAREPRARDRRMSDWGPGSRQRTRPPSPPARAPRPRGPDPGRAARVPRARARALRAMPGRP